MDPKQKRKTRNIIILVGLSLVLFWRGIIVFRNIRGNAKSPEQEIRTAKAGGEGEEEQGKEGKGGDVGQPGDRGTEGGAGVGSQPLAPGGAQPPIIPPSPKAPDYSPFNPLVLAAAPSPGSKGGDPTPSPGGMLPEGASTGIPAPPMPPSMPPPSVSPMPIQPAPPPPNVPPATKPAPTPVQATAPPGNKKPDNKAKDGQKPAAKPEDAQKPAPEEASQADSEIPAPPPPEEPETAPESEPSAPAPAAGEAGFQEPEKPALSLQLVGIILGRPRMAILRSEGKRYYVRERDLIQERYYVERIEPQQVRLRRGANRITLKVGGNNLD